MRRPVLVLIAALAALAAPAPAAAAQDFPTKPIRVIVPFAPGGADVSLRLMQNRLQDELGQPIVVDNRPGAGGVVGAELVARAAPDGYTLMHTSSTNIVTVPLVQKNVPYNPVKDFLPITKVYTPMRVLVARKMLPVASLAELIAYARAHPGQLTYASNGVGSGQHLDGEIFKLAAGVDMTHVVYKGVGPILPALLGQEVDLSFSSTQVILPALKDVKPLAVYHGRAPELAGLPDLGEALPEFRTTPIWIGLFGPARLPAPILARLNRAAVAALRSPDVRARIEGLAATVGASSSAEFAAEIRTQIADTSRLVRRLESRGVRFE